MLADEDELTVTWDGADHDGHRHLPDKTAEAGVRYTITLRGVNKDSVLSPGYNKTGVSAMLSTRKPRKPPPAVPEGAFLLLDTKVTSGSTGEWPKQEARGI